MELVISSSGKGKTNSESQQGLEKGEKVDG